mgnify:CR=1 FL=1
MKDNHDLRQLAYEIVLKLSVKFPIKLLYETMGV